MKVRPVCFPAARASAVMGPLVLRAQPVVMTSISVRRTSYRSARRMNDFTAATARAWFAAGRRRSGPIPWPMEARFLDFADLLPRPVHY